MSNATSSGYSVEAIQDWLLTKLAELLGCDQDSLDINEPFATYGLNSISAVTLSGDLEDWLDLQLEPTLAWDYPTIAALSAYLATLKP